MTEQHPGTEWAAVRGHFGGLAVDLHKTLADIAQRAGLLAETRGVVVWASDLRIGVLGPLSAVPGP